jgi:uncharacterized repeat protein (TIGR01451 family)
MNSSGSSVSSDRHRGATRARRLGLAFVLGLLGVLLMIMTANAYVAKRTQDSLLDFDRGRFFYTGLLDIPPDIHSVQLLPVGLTGEWDYGQPLPLPLADMAATTNGDVIYVVGGTTPVSRLSQVHDGVYTSIMAGVKGALTPWFTEPPLPAPRTGAAAAVYHRDGGSSTIYVIGGLGPGFLLPTDTVYRAQIDNDTGHILGDWIEDPVTVPEPLFYAAAVIYGDYLYVIGGTNGAVSFDTVYYASIDPADGSLGPFVTTSPLLGPQSQGLFDGYAVVYDGDITDTLYYVGGMYLVPNVPPTPPDRFATEEVYFADFVGGGEITEWTRSEGALPRPLYAHGGVLIRDGEILSTGGIRDPLDPFESFTSTVQAALVDPNNPSFRLFNWCETVPNPETCTIGAWLTGKLMPDVRALHGAVTGHGYVYVLGGQDGEQHIVDTVMFGTVNGAGAAYAPEGRYLSEVIDLEQPATFRQLEWHTTIDYPGEMGLAMRYRTKVEGEIWSGWSSPQVGQALTNVIVPEELPTNIRYVQYEVNFTTAITYDSPLLNWVEIYYEVPDPDVAVAKTADVITAQLSSPLEYTILYTNTGGWVAENVVLTETLPEHTTYAGDESWHQVDTRVYTQSVGNLERGTNGSTTFQVQVDEEVPEGVYAIANRVDIDYPPMIDALGLTISDPITIDNSAELMIPLAFTALTVTKNALPTPGSIVTPGSSITYTLGYTNIGGLRVSNAVLTDTFDHRDSYTITEMSQEPDVGGNIWHLGELTPTKGGEITIAVQLADRLPNHWIISNAASLSNPAGDPYQAVVTHTVMNGSFSGSEFVPDPIVDLAITDVHWVPSDPEAGEWPTFFATIVNSGTVDALEPFWVELYIKPSPSDPPQGPKDHDQGYCLGDCTDPPYRRRYVEQVPDGLAMDGSTVVSFENLYDDELEDDNPADFPAIGAYDIYVQVDVSFSDPAYHPYWGFYPEDYESNNIWAGSLVIEEARRYLPIILRGAP